MSQWIFIECYSILDSGTLNLARSSLSSDAPRLVVETNHYTDTATWLLAAPRWCHHDAMGPLILSAERGKKIPWVPLLLGWECLLMGPGTEPCCTTDSACDVRSPFLHPLSEQVCSTMFKVTFRSSVLCAFNAASSWPPNLTTSRFLNGWKRVCCVQGHICGEQALGFALTASKREHRWDHGITGEYGLHLPWERALTCWGSVEAADTISASRNGQWLWFTTQTGHPGWEPVRVLRLQQTWRCQEGMAARMPWIPAHPG